ncbi:MAG: flagellar basal body rod protein FlgB [Sulfuriflexus sp.]|nr:flagellar basal body rod protein FlgB [Sulfuriflexus sp.]
MVINLDNVFGIHTQALTLYSQRSSVLAANLANADTPNFKARDIDFKGILRRAAMKKSNPEVMKATQPGHIGRSSTALAAERLYRQPDQPSLDGNTVEVQKEQAAFTDNAMRYMATLRFVTGRVQGIMLALRGE